MWFTLQAPGNSNERNDGGEVSNKTKSLAQAHEQSARKFASLDEREARASFEKDLARPLIHRRPLERRLASHLQTPPLTDPNCTYVEMTYQKSDSLASKLISPTEMASEMSCLTRTRVRLMSSPLSDDMSKEKTLTLAKRVQTFWRIT